MTSAALVLVLALFCYRREWRNTKLQKRKVVFREICSTFVYDEPCSTFVYGDSCSTLLHDDYCSNFVYGDSLSTFVYGDSCSTFICGDSWSTFVYGDFLEGCPDPSEEYVCRYGCEPRCDGRPCDGRPRRCSLGCHCRLGLRRHASGRCVTLERCSVPIKPQSVPDALPRTGIDTITDFEDAIRNNVKT